jgi:predicted RNase H-like HicB family nuclease
MFVFNNSKILKTGSDVVLGAVYSDEISFNEVIYENLMAQKIQDLIEIYVGDKLNENKSITKEDVLNDLAIMISHKLKIYPDDIESESLAECIMISESYQRFMANIKEGFEKYDTISAFTNPVPVEIDYDVDSFNYEKNVSKIMAETNIKDFIETLYEYDLPILQ